MIDYLPPFPAISVLTKMPNWIAGIQVQVACIVQFLEAPRMQKTLQYLNFQGMKLRLQIWKIQALRCWIAQKTIVTIWFVK